jgi:non-specific serine/threonine protein kinase
MSTLTLTPRGHLLLAGSAELDALAARHRAAVRDAFGQGSAEGLLELGAREVGSALPPDLSYWRDFGARFVAAVCTGGQSAADPAALAAPPRSDLDALAAAVPPMDGAEYLTAEVLESFWTGMAAALARTIAAANVPAQEFLRERNAAWHLVGRVHFNLAENPRDEDAPFAFLATYTTQLATRAKAQHLPLGKALSEYAGAANRSRLLALLLPLQRAAAGSEWLKALVDSGAIYHPLRWTPAEADRFLTDVPRLEAAGIVVRVPAGWRASRPPRPQVTGTVGAKPPSGLGTEALLDFQAGLSLEGEPLNADEIARLLASTQGLHFIRGRWVEVDPGELGRLLEQFRAVESAAAEGRLTFAEAMRLVARAPVQGDVAASSTPDWSEVTAGPWLARTLAALRDPAQLARLDPGPELAATLRPYQQTGVRWLHLLTSLGLGACLADDMGLGKTMQVLALLVILRQRAGPDAANGPSLLVAPASLVANWAAEIGRFAPGLATLIAHPSSMPAHDLQAIDTARVAGLDLVITSYGTLVRTPALSAIPWRLAVLDEAQAIKNPGAKQTRAVKQIAARARIALTGTPVENRLGDLWSIFDFLNPGLLGSARAFTAFTKRLAAEPHAGYAPLRALVRPYLLRRLKTDPSVITDLPEKVEVVAYCSLSRKQAALYLEAVAELKAGLDRVDGMQRKGVVLASLMRLKQICNHPAQWLGEASWSEADSGKLSRLREIGEVIAARQEKVLVFTQFRETTGPIAAFLGSVFGRPGLVLHGQTPVGRRQALVRQFQEDERAPFFVISLKAGGAGLNLTAASHVVHFDRWWNPAVENQATDRAFRIGQTKNVMVHKFVCRGTVEEKIDRLIDSKRQLSQDLLEGNGEALLTELPDDELLRLVALDLGSAAGD